MEDASQDVQEQHGERNDGNNRGRSSAEACLDHRDRTAGLQYAQQPQKLEVTAQPIQCAMGARTVMCRTRACPTSGQLAQVSEEINSEQHAKNPTGNQ